MGINPDKPFRIPPDTSLLSADASPTHSQGTVLYFAPQAARYSICGSEAPSYKPTNQCTINFSALATCYYIRYIAAQHRLIEVRIIFLLKCQMCFRMCHCMAARALDSFNIYVADPANKSKYRDVHSENCNFTLYCSDSFPTLATWPHFLTRLQQMPPPLTQQKKQKIRNSISQLLECRTAPHVASDHKC